MEKLSKIRWPNWVQNYLPVTLLVATVTGLLAWDLIRKNRKKV